MEHAVGSAPAEAPSQETPRPGWWLTIGTLLVAALIAFAGSLLVIALTQPFKLDMTVLVEHAPSSYRDDTPWGFVARAWPALVVALLFGQGVRLAARMHSDWRVRATPVALVVLLMMLIGDDRAGGSDAADGRAFWSLVALVLVTRYVAFTRAPAPPAPSRLWRALIGLVALVVTAAALAYPAFHPLHVQVGDMVNGTSGPQHGFPGDGDRDPRVVDVGLDLRSPAGARIRSIRTDLSSGAPVVVEVADSALTYGPLPPQGVALTGDETLTARVRLERGTCAPGPGETQVGFNSLSIELETLGLRRTQHVTLPRSVTLTCLR